MENNNKKMLTKQDVCRMFQVSPRTIDYWVVQGKFPPPIVIGKGSPRWEADYIDEWIRKHRRETDLSR